MIPSFRVSLSTFRFQTSTFRELSGRPRKLNLNVLRGCRLLFGFLALFEMNKSLFSLVTQS